MSDWLLKRCGCRDILLANRPTEFDGGHDLLVLVLILWALRRETIMIGISDVRLSTSSEDSRTNFDLKSTWIDLTASERYTRINCKYSLLHPLMELASLRSRQMQHYLCHNLQVARFDRVSALIRKGYVLPMVMYIVVWMFYIRHYQFLTQNSLQ